MRAGSGGQDPLTSMATTVPSWESWQLPSPGSQGGRDEQFTSLGLFPATCLKAKPRLRERAG